jgi:hypothetical protein
MGTVMPDSTCCEGDADGVGEGVGFDSTPSAPPASPAPSAPSASTVAQCLAAIASIAAPPEVAPRSPSSLAALSRGSVERMRLGEEESSINFSTQNTQYTVHSSQHHSTHRIQYIPCQTPPLMRHPTSPPAPYTLPSPYTITRTYAPLYA